MYRRYKLHDLGPHPHRQLRRHLLYEVREQIQDPNHSHYLHDRLRKIGSVYGLPHPAKQDCVLYLEPTSRPVSPLLAPLEPAIKKVNWIEANRNVNLS